MEQPELAYLHVPITASKISFNIITDIMISELPLSQNNKVINLIISCSKQYLFYYLNKWQIVTSFGTLI